MWLMNVSVWTIGLIVADTRRLHPNLIQSIQECDLVYIMIISASLAITTVRFWYRNLEQDTAFYVFVSRSLLAAHKIFLETLLQQTC